MSTGDAQPLAPIPPAVKRLRWWFAVPCVFTLAQLAAVQLPLGPIKYTLAYSVAERIAMMANFGLWFAAALIMIRGRQRIRRAVTATSGRSCTACIYDLSGLDYTGNCPECGHTFDTSADLTSWARAKMFD